MPRQVIIFDPPDRFVAGTVGQPGERTFFLQASGGGRVVSVALEKTQVALLGERLDQLLDEVRRRGATTGDVTTPDPDDSEPLEVPIFEEFRVATLALGWDVDDERVVVEALAAGEEGEDEGDEAPEPLSDELVASEGPPVLRVRITAGSARAFARRAGRLVAAGRPPCPLCGLPLDPDGHVCPRQNGHRR